MSRRRQKLPKELMHAKIESLSHEGRGVARVDEKTTFIDFALPNEDVEFRYTRRKAAYDEGIAEKVANQADSRVEPVCQYFGLCGGCSLQHMAPSLQIKHKQQVLLEQLQHFADAAPEKVLDSMTASTTGYRRKARLGVRFVKAKAKVLVGFKEKNGRYITDMDSCQVLDPRVGLKLQALAELIQSLEACCDIAQIEVAIGDNDAALVFRHMKPLTQTDQDKLVEFAKSHRFHLYLQPGGIETVHRVYPSEGKERLYYQLPAYDLEMPFHPMDFTQVNAEINQQMVESAIGFLDLQESDEVLDLFCGLGNFTLAIARHAAKVVGVEGGTEMVERAKENAQHNHINNVEFFAADLTTDLQNQEWLNKKYNKILLDPPRSGAAEILQQLPLHAKRIVYVSCNPATLARDAGILKSKGYCLHAAGVMDMFPHTKHVESIAVFNKKD